VLLFGSSKHGFRDYIVLPLATNIGDTILVTSALLPSRNDTIATATPIVPGTYYASLSRYTAASGSAAPDQDYYVLSGVNAGETYEVGVSNGYMSWNGTYSTPTISAVDPALELVDTNGNRLATCNDPVIDSPPSDAALVRRTSQTRASATHPPASEHRILTSTSRHRPPTRPSTSISSTSTVVPVLTSPTLSLSLRSSNGPHAQPHRAILYAGCRQGDDLTCPGPSKGVDGNQPLECCATSAARARFLWNEEALIEDRFRH